MKLTLLKKLTLPILLSIYLVTKSLPEIKRGFWPPVDKYPCMPPLPPVRLVDRADDRAQDGAVEEAVQQPGHPAEEARQPGRREDGEGTTRVIFRLQPRGLWEAERDCWWGEDAARQHQIYYCALLSRRTQVLWIRTEVFWGGRKVFQFRRSRGGDLRRATRCFSSVPVLSCLSKETSSNPRCCVCLLNIWRKDCTIVYICVSCISFLRPCHW